MKYVKEAFKHLKDGLDLFPIASLQLKDLKDIL